MGELGDFVDGSLEGFFAIDAYSVTCSSASLGSGFSGDEGRVSWIIERFPVKIKLVEGCLKCGEVRDYAINGSIECSINLGAEEFLV